MGTASCLAETGCRERKHVQVKVIAKVLKKIFSGLQTVFKKLGFCGGSNPFSKYKVYFAFLINY